MGEEDNNPGGQGPDDSIKINPNWNPLLEKIPEALHPMILPELQKWDQGVDTRFKEINEQYSPFKQLVKDGYDPEDIQRALMLQQAINEDPENFIKQSMEYFNSNVPEWKLRLADAQQNTDPEDTFTGLGELGDLNVDDLRKMPQFKELFDSVEQAKSFMEEYQEAQEDDEATEELEQYLKDLHEEHGDFDDMYVAALLTQDIDGEVAVKDFQKRISDAAAALNGGGQNNTQQQNNQQQNTNAVPPVVMGQGGSIGSGLPDGKVRMGDLSKRQTTDLVRQMLQAGNTDNN